MCKQLMIGTAIVAAYLVGTIQRVKPEPVELGESHTKVTRKTNDKLTKIYQAIRQVETGGHPDPANAIGDGGASLGPMQIGRLYFIDAMEHDEVLRASEIVYEDVRNESIARRVMFAYWSRYARRPWTAEDLCRLHNGGPSRGGSATDRYWDKCKAILEVD